MKYYLSLVHKLEAEEIATITSAVLKHSLSFNLLCSTKEESLDSSDKLPGGADE